MVITYTDRDRECCRYTIDIDALIESNTEIRGKKVILHGKRLLRKIFTNIIKNYDGNLSKVGDYIFQINQDAGKMFYGCL